MQEGEDLSSAITDIFGLEMGDENYTTLLNAFDTNFGTTILNMGQNVEKFKNTIDSFYAKAGE